MTKKNQPGDEFEDSGFNPETDNEPIDFDNTPAEDNLAGVFPFGADANGNPLEAPAGKSGFGDDDDVEFEDNKGDDDVELDAEGNPIIKNNAGDPPPAGNEGDISDEDLEKLINSDGNAEPELPKVTTALLAKELGIQVEDGKEPELDTVLSEIKRLRTFDSEEDEDVRQMKIFKALNPEKNVYDYLQTFASPFEPVLRMNDEDLYQEYLIQKFKKTPEDAAFEIKQMKEADEFETKAKAVRAAVEQASNTYVENKRNELVKNKEKHNQIAKQNLTTMLSHLKENPKVFNGYFKLQNTDIKDILEDVKAGGLQKAIKDPKTHAELVYFYKNRDKILNIIKDNGFEDGKGLVLSVLANQQIKKPTRTNPAPKVGQISSKDW
jgi:hypothetical protein